MFGGMHDTANLESNKLIGQPGFSSNTCSNWISLYFSHFYNIFQIKKLDPTSKRVSTVAGTGKAGFKDGISVTAQVGRLFCTLIYQVLSML
jgi:hypothetical protein